LPVENAALVKQNAANQQLKLPVEPVLAGFIYRREENKMSIHKRLIAGVKR
jgi:hypothetical protein